MDEQGRTYRHLVPVFLMADETDLLTDTPEDAEKVAKRHEKELIAAILSALLLLRSQVSTYQIIPARVWRDFRSSLSGAIAPVFDAHDEAARDLYRAFDSLDPAVVSGQRAYRKLFIDAFETETRRAVDFVSTWGEINGLTSEQVAEILGYTAGVNRRQTGALLVKWMQLHEAGAEEESIVRMMLSFANDAAKDRAVMTASTELWNAVQQGREAAAIQAQNRSNEDIEIRKFWEVAWTEKTCPVCAAIPGMNPEGVPVGQPFRTPIGDRMGPTIHPRCRCGERFEVLSPALF